MNDQYDNLPADASDGTGHDTNDENRVLATDGGSAIGVSFTKHDDAWQEPEVTAIAEPTVIAEPPAPRRTGWHPVNVGQLAMGLVFLTAVGVWGLIQSDTVTGDDIRWLLPLPWVIGGGIGLVAAAISSVRRHGVR